MSDMALGLYTCDIVCYGAASPGIFGAYTDALQARARAQVARYDNRGAGIPTHGESRITYATGAIEEATTASKAWMRLWPGYLVRESCFKCGHHSVRRPGDLTIGDFWGLERFKPELVDRWGVSLVLVNRGRGIDLLESAAKRITLAPATAEQAANEAQPMLSHPSARGKRDVFWAELYATDFSEACRRVGVDGFARRAKDCMRLTQKKIIKFRNGNVDSEGHGQPDAWSNLPSIDFDSIREAGEWPAVFAAVNRSDDVRRESSSGGVFHALASHVIEDLGGVVYGCAFDENLRAVHIRCEDLDQAKRCMGSKYSQSVMDNSIQNVADDLKRGRTVLFTGTPCQVAAVRAACGNAGGGALLMADIICHGVPSPALFQEWLGVLEERRGAAVVSYEHRPKSMGWGHHERVTYADGASEQDTRWADGWKRLFYGNKVLRTSCYRCPYTRTMRGSDLTLGDFWGIEYTRQASLRDELGVSVVLCNTQQGFGLLAESGVHLVKASLDDALPKNPMLARPSTFTGSRDDLWQAIFDQGLLKTMKSERIMAGAVHSLAHIANRRVAHVLRRLS